MKDKKFDDFMRFVRRYCKEHNLYLQEDTKTGGAHNAYTIFDKNGKESVKLDRLVIPANRKEIKQGSLRRILHHMKDNLEKKISAELSDELLEKLQELTEQLTRWLNQ